MATNGYVTIEEMDTYVAAHYTSDDALRVRWEALSESDKAVMLTKSFNDIEVLPFTGCKADKTQVTQFPRFGETEVSQSVKDAQMDNAIWLCDQSAKETENTYNTLWRFGVESYRIGNLSETSKGGAWGHSGGVISPLITIFSSKAIKLLQGYLSGGYRI